MTNINDSPAKCDVTVKLIPVDRSPNCKSSTMYLKRQSAPPSGIDWQCVLDFPRRRKGVTTCPVAMSPTSNFPGKKQYQVIPNTGLICGTLPPE